MLNHLVTPMAAWERSPEQLRLLMLYSTTIAPRVVLVERLAPFRTAVGEGWVAQVVKKSTEPAGVVAG